MHSASLGKETAHAHRSTGFARGRPAFVRAHLFALAVILYGLLAIVAPAQTTPHEIPRFEPAESENVVVGITTPSRQATLAAVMAARIAQIHKEEGAAAKAGEAVVALDDAVQRARVAIAEAAADSPLTVDLARAERDRAQQDLTRLEGLSDDSSASRKELHDARTSALTRQLEYELALFEHGQAVRALEREQALLAEHHIRSPFAGYVVEHLKHEGETVDHLEGIVTLVQLDPLRVTVDCPLRLGARVRLGDSAYVIPIGIDRAPRVGRVSHVSPIVDVGSQTIRIKIDVENPDNEWMAGMKVAVTFALGDRPEAHLAAQRIDGAPQSESPDSKDERNRQ